MEHSSGKIFAPYDRKRTFRWQTSHTEPVSTLVDTEPLIQAAVLHENECFEQGAGDSEGLDVSLRPLSPLTDLESDDDTETPDQPIQPTGQSSGPRSIEKRRRNASANRRRSKKRVKVASSSHGPLTYAAKLSVAKHYAEELQPLRASIDVGTFPASGSGSWVGKRGRKGKPWTMPELICEGFSVIEWDGR
jgi:hypothetical protein